MGNTISQARHILLNYRHVLDGQHSGQDAERLARRIVNLPRLITALRAVQDLLNSDRDDVEHVVELVDDVLDVITVDEPLPHAA